MSGDEVLVTIALVVGALLLAHIVWRVIRGRIPERAAELVGQLLPVIFLVVLLVTGLIIIDPEQGTCCSSRRCATCRRPSWPS